MTLIAILIGMASMREGVKPTMQPNFFSSTMRMAAAP